MDIYIPWILLADRYATASARSDGMFLVCGGRDASGAVMPHILIKLLYLNMFTFSPYITGYGVSGIQRVRLDDTELGAN